MKNDGYKEVKRLLNSEEEVAQNADSDMEYALNLSRLTNQY